MHDISYEHYPAIREILDKHVLAEDFTGSEIEVASGITWFEIVKTLTAATIAKRNKAGKFSEASILKKLDFEAFQGFLSYLKADAQGPWGIINLAGYRTEGAGSLLGRNATITHRMGNAAFRIKGGIAIYFDRLNRRLSDRAITISDEILISAAVSMAADLANMPDIESFGLAKDELELLTNPDKIFEAMRISNFSREGYSTITAALPVKGMLISGAISPTLNGHTDGLSYFFIEAIKHSNILQVLHKEVVAILNTQGPPPEMSMKPQYMIHKPDAQSHDWQDKSKIRVSIRVVARQIDNTLMKTCLSRHAGDIQLSRHATEKQTKAELVTQEWKLTSSMLEMIANVETRHYIARKRQSGNITKGAIKVDRVAQFLLERVRQADPDAAQEIMKTGFGKHRLDYKFLEGFVRPRLNRADENGDEFRKFELIYFKTKNGEMTVNMNLANGMNWSGNRLYIPNQPQVVLDSMRGRPAGDIVDHPIAKLLGNIKKATCNRHRSWITFENIMDEKPLAA